MTGGLDNTPSTGTEAQVGGRRDSPRSQGSRSWPPLTSSVVGVAGALLLAMVMAAWFGPAPARAESTGSTDGEALYVQHCAACHQAAGEGIEGTFPPLAGSEAAADAAYVETVIREGLSGPIEVFGVSYDADMPPVAALADAAEIEAVVRHVVGLAGPTEGGQDGEPDDSDEPVATPISEEVTGDIDRGRDLFVGSTRFENGGAACAACHVAGSVGNLGGQSLGPDLTDAAQALGGDVGLASWMSNPPSPTMQPLFADRPLSEGELADVVAFLGDAPNQDRPGSGVDRLTVAGVVGLVVLVGGMALAWRGMRQTYVDRLRSRSRGRRVTPPRSKQRSRSSAVATATAQTDRRHQTAEAGRSSQ